MQSLCRHLDVLLFQALKLSNSARKETTVGEIVNLMSVDAQKIHDIAFNIHELWACFLQLVMAMVYLWYIMGISAFAGLGIMAILSPINGFYLVRKFNELQVI